MKTAYGILIGVVATIFGIVALLAFLQIGSHSFLKEHETFVKKFALEYSHTWDMAEVQDSLANEFLEQMSTSNGREVARAFGQMGRIESISDFELAGYTTGTGGDVGVFKFKAEFVFASGVVTVTVVERESGPRILGFRVNLTSQEPSEERERKA